MVTMVIMVTTLKRALENCQFVFVSVTVYVHLLKHHHHPNHRHHPPDRLHPPGEGGV